MDGASAWRQDLFITIPLIRPVVLIVLLKVVLTFVFLLLAVLLYIWWERKFVSDLQNRIGPDRAGPHGILQSLADGMKLIFKEELRPKAADAFLFTLAPAIAAVAAFTAFATVPFGAETTFFGLLDQPRGFIFGLAGTQAEPREAAGTEAGDADAQSSGAKGGVVHFGFPFGPPSLALLCQKLQQFHSDLVLRRPRSSRGRLEGRRQGPRPHGSRRRAKSAAPHHEAERVSRFLTQ